MFALELGGKEYAWDSNVIIGLFSTVVILLIIFFVERNATEPIISFHLFKKPLFAASQGVAFFYGAAFIICTVYIPIFVQGVLVFSLKCWVNFDTYDGSICNRKSNWWTISFTNKKLS